MDFKLMALPYEPDALEPFVSRKTVDVHLNKHHHGYLRKLDAALEGDDRRSAPLEQILAETEAEGDLFNLAAQVLNHNYYWQSLSPTKTQLQVGPLDMLIKQAFGGQDGFREAFAAAAANEFGSGWAWLAFEPNARNLEVFSTTDAVNPLVSGHVPLLTLDVWEHAYYLDYQNERGRYIETFLDAHVNWDFAENNLKAALKT